MGGGMGVGVLKNLEPPPTVCCNKPHRAFELRFPNAGLHCLKVLRHRSSNRLLFNIKKTKNLACDSLTQTNKARLIHSSPAKKKDRKKE